MNKPVFVPYEHTEQKMFVKWFRMQFKTVRLLAIPNGGKRTGATAWAMKAEGQSAGVPDMQVPEWGLWIEMKRQKGSKISDEQAAWIVYLQRLGQRVIVAYGFDDAKKQVEAFLAERQAA